MRKADGGQQIADSRQQTADSRRPCSVADRAFLFALHPRVLRAGCSGVARDSGGGAGI